MAWSGKRKRSKCHLAQQTEKRLKSRPRHGGTTTGRVSWCDSRNSPRWCRRKCGSEPGSPAIRQRPLGLERGGCQFISSTRRPPKGDREGVRRTLHRRLLRRGSRILKSLNHGRGGYREKPNRGVSRSLIGGRVNSGSSGNKGRPLNLKKC